MRKKLRNGRLGPLSTAGMEFAARRFLLREAATFWFLFRKKCIQYLSNKKEPNKIDHCGALVEFFKIANARTLPPNICQSDVLEA
ncbi:MAG: hypothetical protein GY820_22330 [Gammaproteobacteria bacterium]|nr:hypothetical protein [Gammaproteobacteria bacterium]